MLSPGMPLIWRVGQQLDDQLDAEVDALRLVGLGRDPVEEPEEVELLADLVHQGRKPRTLLIDSTV